MDYLQLHEHTSVEVRRANHQVQTSNTSTGYPRLLDAIMFTLREPARHSLGAVELLLILSVQIYPIPYR